MTILSIIIGIIILLDVLTFLVKATGNASNFMWYLCRPLWGILGNGVYQNISMSSSVSSSAWQSRRTHTHRRKPLQTVSSMSKVTIPSRASYQVRNPASEESPFLEASCQSMPIRYIKP